MDDQLYLQWNDYKSNISSTFKDLRQENDFYDVTLACEDDKQIQAHKLVLASSSSFFKNILRKNPHQHPLLYLKGINSKELTSLLEFVYVGEIHIGQQDLESFLVAAEDLKIKGLTQGTKNGPKESSNSKPIRKRKEPSYDPVAEDEDIQEVTEIKTEHTNAVTTTEDTYPEQDQQQNYGYWDYDNDNSQENDQENNPLAMDVSGRTDINTCSIEGDLFERVGTAWSCGICKKIISSRKRLIDHLVETHQMSESKVQFMISRR